METDVPQEAKPRNMEPEKCEGWIWQEDLSEMEGPIFLPLEKYISSGYIDHLKGTISSR
jgi:8-oxo-dGTP diphosphatase